MQEKEDTASFCPAGRTGFIRVAINRGIPCWTLRHALGVAGRGRKVMAAQEKRNNIRCQIVISIPSCFSSSYAGVGDPLHPNVRGIPRRTSAEQSTYSYMRVYMPTFLDEVGRRQEITNRDMEGLF